MRSLALFLLIITVGCTGSEGEGGEPFLEESAQSNRSLSQAVVTSSNAEVGADAGYIADGDTITLPTGFTADQCVFTAALAAVRGSAINSRVSVNTTTGEVTCKVLVQERVQEQPKDESCTASYTVICAK